jgi:hypothetical protein
MSVSDLLRTIGAERVDAAISLVDSAFHVRIHGIELGLRDMADPDTSQPNPTEIRYTQEFEIVVHKTVGTKPKTQCTIPEGLWNVMVKFNVLKGPDNDLSKVLTDIKALDAGPGRVESAFFGSPGVCMFLQKKEIVQSKAAKDWYHSVELSLIESNPGTL